MSDAIMILGNTAMVPDHIRNAGQSELTKDLMQKMGGVSVKRISIRGKMFRLVVGGEEVAKRSESMDVVVVNIAKDVSRTYYEGAYDPKAEAAPPTCWSSDSKVPHPSVESPKHSNCADCPMNINGSGQGTTRACRFKRRIAVVLADDVDAGVHMLELPATSLFGKGKDDRTMPFEQYFKYIASQNHSIDHLVTRMRFDDDADTPKLYFSAIAFPTADMMPLLAAYGRSEEAKAAVTMTVYQVDKKEPTEPTVKAAGKKDAPTPKVDVSDALSKFTRKAAEVDDE
jgi:hypothetical protein